MKSTCILLILLFISSLSFTTRALAQSDYGDAPDPSYPTLSASNGASHLLGGNFLGFQIDFEADGQPSQLAQGDDGNGFPDDEDGVFFSGWLVPGQNATLIINASLPNFLDAWIDFQGNGNWSDPGDQIFTSQILNGGLNTLTIAVPPTASAGIFTYCRFRISSMGGLSTTGSAIDGEVEDYFIYLGLPNVGNTIIDPDAGLEYVQNEISMDVVPSTGTLIAAYNDNPYPSGPGIGVSTSTDNGVTWSDQQLNYPISSISGTNLLDAFDPTVACDDLGNTFVAHISTDNNWGVGPVNGLFVHKTADDGLNWSSPVVIDEEGAPTGSPDPNYRFNDRCQIRVDKNTSSPYYNNIYVTWIKDRGWNMPNPDSDIYVSISTDNGAVFSTANQINNPLNSMGNMPVQAVASNGDLYVLWMEYNVITGGTGVMLLDKSTDGGVTWGNDIVVDTILLPPLQLNGGIEARAKGAAVIRTSPSNSNQLYIVYAADPDNLGADEADIFFISSSDGGATWSSPPLRVNDDVSTNDQVLPWMEVKTSGVIDIVWYDRRNDPLDLAWDVYSTTSVNGGSSFATNTQLNVTSFSTPQTASGPWFGEYLALAVADSTAHVVFTSSAIDPKGDVYYTNFINPAINLTIEELGNELNEPIIYPNPTSDIITIDIVDNDKMLLEVYDHLGKLVLSTLLIDQLSFIDMSDYPSGFYLFKLSVNGRSITKKVVKE